MINKIFKPKPTSTIKATAFYLLGSTLDNRPQATLLHGDPREFIELVESLPFAQKFTAGVLTCLEADINSATQIKHIREFESMLLAGMDASRYSAIWVLHKDKGKTELNYCIAHTDLATGKELTPYFDRADRQRVNAWLDVQNILHGYADPKDPSRKQAVKIPRDLPKGRRETIALIAACVEDGIKEGLIENRRDVVKLIKKLGYIITSEKPSSISIRPKTSSPDIKPVRLQGGYFQQEFDNSNGAAERAEASQRAFESTARERLADAEQKLDRLMQIKHARYSARYGQITEAEFGGTQPSSENSDKLSSTSGRTESSDRNGNPNVPRSSDSPNSKSAGRTKANADIQQHTDNFTSVSASSNHHFTALENPYDIFVDPFRADAYASSSRAATNARKMRERVRDAERRNSDAAKVRDAQRARAAGSPTADSQSSKVITRIRTAIARVGQFAEWATAKVSQLIVRRNEQNVAKVRMEEAEALERVNARVKPVLARLRNIVERRLQDDEALDSNSAAWNLLFTDQAWNDPDLTHLREQVILFGELEQERDYVTNYSFSKTLASFEKEEQKTINEFYAQHADPQKLESISKSLKRMEDLADLHRQPIFSTNMQNLSVRPTNEPIKSKDSDNDFNLN